jgi:hypothetical protein
MFELTWDSAAASIKGDNAQFEFYSLIDECICPHNRDCKQSDSGSMYLETAKLDFRGSNIAFGLNV